jgi:multidrug resistance efflux pump
VENLTHIQTEELRARVEEAMEALRDRARGLIAAIAAHAEARLAYEAALDDLEDARARAIREGLEGRNERERQAELLQKTREAEERARTARAVYRVAEANLEMARVAWAVEKEALRVLTALLGEGRA